MKDPEPMEFSFLMNRVGAAVPAALAGFNKALRMIR